MSQPSRHERPSGGVIPGLLKGLATTARSVTRRHHTVEYPDVKPKLPPRTRGVIALTEENCTSCMLCARECPDWCIYIDSHKEEIPATTPGGRARQRNVLDRFAIDFSLCMYCGICVEVCPFDALHWSPEFEYSEIDIRDLLHEKDRLAQWMATVPPPPALDPGSPEPAEVSALNRPVRPAPGAARAAAAEGGPGQTTRPERPARRTDRPAPSGDRPARPATARRTPAPGTTPPPEVEPTEPAHTATPAEEASAAPSTESTAAPSTETAAAPAERPAAGPPETPAPGGPVADRTGDQTQPMPSAAPPDDTQQLPPASEPTETVERPGPAETQVLPPARPEREDS